MFHHTNFNAKYSWQGSIYKPTEKQIFLKCNKNNNVKIKINNQNIKVLNPQK